MLNKEEYIEKKVRDILNGEMKLEDFVKEHFELVEKYNNTKISLENISKEYDEMLKNFEILGNNYDDLYFNFYRPKPYKFEDLKPNMFVFDLVKNRVNKILEIFDADCSIPYLKFDDGFGEWFIIEFKENRFYPVQMANVRCE